MGFETSNTHLSSSQQPHIFELFPYGIWNPIYTKLLIVTLIIWTISLWDLKLTE